jgi:sugar lactone lactonase YvrE
MAENLHPVANPAVDADGNLFATFSGTRGQQVPVSIFSIDRDFQIRPFVRDLLNPTGLAFGPDGYLYASSRAEGTVYRISPDGDLTVYAEGLGIATGIAFDRDGNLYVGDRSGTIFKIAAAHPTRRAPREIFVFATLEPSMAAYHLAFNDAGTLFVTGPTTSSNQAIHAIDPDGATTVFYQGLGRAQGMAFDVDDNLYVAASSTASAASSASPRSARPRSPSPAQPRRPRLPRRRLRRPRHPRRPLPRSPRHLSVRKGYNGAALPLQ